MKIECTIDDIHDRGHLKIQNYESIDVGKSVEVSMGVEKCTVRLKDLKAAIDSCMNM